MSPLKAFASAALVATWLPAGAACLSDAQVTALFDAYSRAVPAANPEGLSMGLGVMGRPLLVPATRAERYALQDALREMVAVVKSDGVEIDRGKGVF